MGTGADISYNRYSSTQTIATGMLVIPFMGEHPSVGSVQATRTHGQDITAVDTGTQTFTVAGDSTDVFKTGESFVIRASVGNDGTYTCNGDATLVSGDTEIVVNESISSATVDGVIDVGQTGIVTVELQMDSDESSGEQDLQVWCRFKITPAISSSGSDDGLGRATFAVEFTPILGGGSTGTRSTQTFTHDETVDAWQTAAGRSRQ